MKMIVDNSKPTQISDIPAKIPTKIIKRIIGILFPYSVCFRLASQYVSLVSPRTLICRCNNNV